MFSHHPPFLCLTFPGLFFSLIATFHSFQLILGFSLFNRGMPSTTSFLSCPFRTWNVCSCCTPCTWNPIMASLLQSCVFDSLYALLILPFHVVTFLIPFCKHHSLLSLSTDIVAFICIGLIHRRKIFRILATLPASPQIFLCCILNFIS